MRKILTRRLKHGRAVFLGLLAGFVLAFGARAGTLDLSNVPLFLSSGADPNIMLLFDDATSMDFQMAADVSLLNVGTSKYPEVDQGEPIGLQCNFSLAAILASLLQLPPNLIGPNGLTAQIQNLVQCLVGTRVEDANGILQAPEAIVGGVCTAAQNAVTTDINNNNQVALLVDQTLLTTCIVTNLVSNSLSLNLLNPPQYHYAYLNDTDDNYFAASASDYTNGFLPIMLEEAMINPAGPVSTGELNGGSNTNFRPPLLSTFVCAPGLGGNSNCNSPVVLGIPLGTAKYTDNTYAPTGALGNADTRNACQYPAYSFKGVAANATVQGTTISTGYWRAWNSSYNPVAYNPEVTYKPWKGYDSAGNAFANATPTAVRYDPLNPSDTYNITVPQRHRGAIAYRCGDNIIQNILAGGTVLNSASNSVNVKRLTATPTAEPIYSGPIPPTTIAQAGNLDGSTPGSYNAYVKAHNAWALTWLQVYPARYYTWKNNNGNTLVDPWETHRLIEIRATGGSGTLSADGITGATACPVSGAFGSACPSNFTHTAARTDCPSGTCTAAQELQNYANWFQYYRRRELMAKAAYANVIANKQGARMGFAALVKNANTRVPGPLGGASNAAAPVADPTVVTASPGYAVQRKIEPLDPDYTISGTNYSALGTVNTKRDLLDHLVRTNSGGGGTSFFGLTKPLRSAVDNVGQYIECNTAGNPYGFTHTETGTGLNTLTTSCPMLNQASGGACQQNFAVVVTDGFWDTADGFNSAGNADGDRNTAYDGGAYADTQSNTLGDIAMKYYENDLATALPNSEPALPGVDEAPHQHLVNFSVAFGLNGALTSNPPNPTAGFTWPNPYLTDEAKIDDLRHAAYNGRGQFIAANDSNSLEQALSRIFTDITSRSSSASSVALNSGSLNIGTTVFQARFDSSNWTGQLLAFAISPGPGFTRAPCVNEPKGALCTPQLWDAGTVIKSQNYDSGRVILTYNSETKVGVPFRWANISAAQQQSLLNKDPVTLATDANGQKRLNYIRGSNADEVVSGGSFRTRATPLGDIINSDPFFVGAPRGPYDNMTGYGAFRTGHLDRDQMVYVGANDGMLHGFRASDGHEMMAFVPGDLKLYRNLPLLTTLSYQSAHRYFADGSPTVNDAVVNGNWKTVLVTGLRRGGQSVSALDVTDPGSFSESSASNLVLWQFSDNDDADLGYTFSRPSIVKLHGSGGGKWAVIFGNGYNNSETATGDTATGSGEACLFILYMDGPGGDHVWTAGTEYKKICVTSGGPSNSGRPNGLATPSAVDLNADNLIDAVYAGDMEGNMWKFDVSSNSDSSWGVAYSGNPLFTACTAACTDSNRQPITTRPEVGAHPTGNPGANGVLVFFGTGKYFENGDDSPTGQQTQTFYSVYDQMWGTATNTPGSPPTLPFQRDSLVQQQIIREEARDGTDCVTDGNCYRVTTENPVTLTPINGVPTDQGWYLDLINTQNGNTNNFGERTVSNASLRGKRIVFTTLIPLQDICTFGGKGWLMELAFDSGGRLPNPAWDITNDQMINGNDTVPHNGTGVPPSGAMSPNGIIPSAAFVANPDGTGGGGDGTCEEFKYFPGSNGKIFPFCESADYKAGRITWRQIR